MRHSAIAPLLLLFLSACGAGPQFPGVVRSELPLPGGYTSYMYSMDASARSEAGDARAIVFLHGGGLIAGSPTLRRFDEFSRWLASHGHTVLSLKYPLLWQGLDRAEGTSLLHEGLRTLVRQGHHRLAIVAVSAGAWIAERGLEDGKREGWPELAGLDRFGGVSPLVAVDHSTLRLLVAAIYERATPAPVDPSALPKLLLIQGDSDWLVPAESAAPL